jgi:hypothetical protein
MLSGRSFATVVCVMGSCITCFAQNPVRFSNVTSTGGETGVKYYPVDVNNDGIADIVQNTWSAPFGFTVSMARGDGTFSPPIQYNYPPDVFAPQAMGFADFNNDGKVDIIVPVAATNEILIYVGNGNGTFQSPKISYVDLPAGYTFANSPLVTADFNHDGRIDVIAVDSYQQCCDITTGLAVLQGDGRGNLTYRNQIFTDPGEQFTSVVGGDFDADNNADVAVVGIFLCAGGAGICSSELNVLYGDGKFGFTKTTPFFPKTTPASSNSGFSVAAGDLNGDGSTDLFGNDGQLVLLYGQHSRKFTQYYLPAQIIPSGMADFNGDGKMDLVGYGNGGIEFLLAGNGPGDFTAQTFPIPAYNSNTNLVIGDFNNDKRPDLAYSTLPGFAVNGPSAITVMLNQTVGYFGACPFPRAAQGISMCHPSSATVTSPVIFNAMANSFGNIRKFELWVDGKKLAEEHHSWGQKAYFDLYTPLSAGSHFITLNVTNIDNDAMDYNEVLTVK